MLIAPASVEWNERGRSIWLLTYAKDAWSQQRKGSRQEERETEV